MLTAKPLKIEKEAVDNVHTYIFWGFPLGIISGIIGIGGGVLMVPVMVIAMRFKMHQAVGTSTALMILTSTGGIIAYIINGFRIACLLIGLC